MQQRFLLCYDNCIVEIDFEWDWQLTSEQMTVVMVRRLNTIYTDIYKAEDALRDVELKKETLQQEKLNIKTIYSLLSSFDKIYDKMSKEERRSFVKYLISDVQLYTPEERKMKARFCKSITYRFPIEKEVLSEFSDNGIHVETVCLLAKP